MVHIVPAMGLQAPSAPSILSLALPLGTLCSVQWMAVSIHFCICQALAEPLRRQLYQAPVSKLLLASAIVSSVWVSVCTTSVQLLLAFIVSAEKSGVILIGLPLYVIDLFPLLLLIFYHYLVHLLF